jgi:ribosome-binding protein aMBF1 (putative translation factor)
MHNFVKRRTRRSTRIKDPVERAIAESFGHLIVALRIKQKQSRHVVVQRVGINWKRIRQLEEGTVIVCLHEVVKLAKLYHVSYAKLLRDTLQDGAFLRAYDLEVRKA